MRLEIILVVLAACTLLLLRVVPIRSTETHVPLQAQSPLIPSLGVAYAPTPVDRLRRAAAVYVPDMFLNDSRTPPLEFERGATPCWADGHYCLPAFHILGVYQAAVRDLYTRIAQHPGVAKHAAVSPSFYSEAHPWKHYMSAMAPAAAQAKQGKLVGEASAVTFHFVWVHQEQFNKPYVEAMGKFWRACNGRSDAEKRVLPHRDCMGRRMAEARAADEAMARRAGMAFGGDGVRTFSVPQLMRAAYGDGFFPALMVVLRLPWRRLHAAFYNYQHYGRRYGQHADGEARWAADSIVAFRRCESNFSTDLCALGFESLSREGEETFYHCDQLIKGMYATFMQRWRREHPRVLALRFEEYVAKPEQVLSRALTFLGLSVPKSAREWSPLLSSPRQLHGTRPAAGSPPMHAATEAQLQAFYAPSLSRLLSQLADAADAAEWRAWAAPYVKLA